MIEATQNITFTGSKQLAKDADWICRKSRNAFPIIPINKLYFDNKNRIEASNKLVEFFNEKEQLLTKHRDKRKSLSVPVDILVEMLDFFRKGKIAHCLEYTVFAELIAKVNGVKNVARCGLDGIDHGFLVVADNSKKIKFSKYNLANAYIVDPWTGVSGKVKEVLFQLKTYYAKSLNLDEAEDVRLKCNFESLKLTPEEIRYFRKKYPQLVFKSSRKHKLMNEI